MFYIKYRLTLETFILATHHYDQVYDYLQFLEKINTHNIMYR